MGQHLDLATWIRSQAASIIQQYCTCTKGYQRANLLWGPGSIWGASIKSCATYKMRKGGCCGRPGQWETPRPHRSRPDAKLSRMFVPFLPPFPLFLAVNEWTHSNSHQSPHRGEKFKPSGLQSNWSRLFPPCASVSGSCMSFRNTHKRTSRPPTFRIAPQSYVASVGTTIGPMRVLKFPAVSKKKKKRRPSSRPVDYCLGKPEISGAPEPPLSFRVTVAQTHPESPAAAYGDIFRRKNTTYLFQIVHSGIFSLSTFFPLSRSTVRPASAPLWPLLWLSPGGAGLRNAEVQPQHICHYHWDVSVRAGQRIMSQSKVVPWKAHKTEG